MQNILLFPILSGTPEIYAEPIERFSGKAPLNFPVAPDQSITAKGRCVGPVFPQPICVQSSLVFLGAQVNFPVSIAAVSFVLVAM